MSEHDLSTQILKHIKEDHITPKPRWTFLLKDSVVWGTGISAILIGGVAVSVMIYTVRHDDWSILAGQNDSFYESIFFALPYFWFLVLAGFAAIARYNFRHTKHGYQYRLPTVLIGVVACSGVAGILFHDVGIGRAIDRLLETNVPQVERYIHPRYVVWSRPEKGMIAGTVIRIQDENQFDLRDFRERIWTIQVQPHLPQRFMVTTTGTQIRCLGNAQPSGTFEAYRILPWRPEGHRPIMKLLPRMMNERMQPTPAY